MKKIKTFALAILLPVVCIFCACGGGNASLASYEGVEAVPLVADSVAINEILDPDSWQVTDGNMLMVSKKTKKALFHYTLPQWKFVDTLMERGEGPHDVQYPSFSPSGNSSVYISDVVRGNVFKLSVNEGKVCVDTVLSTRVTGLRFMNTSCVMEDKYILEHRRGSVTLENITDIVPEYLYVIDMRNGELTDSVMVYEYSKTEIKSDGKGNITSIRGMIYNIPTVAICGDRFLLHYPLGDMTQVMRIKDGRIEDYRLLGEKRTFEEITTVDWEKLRRERNKTTEIIGCDKSHVYLCVRLYDMEESVSETGEKISEKIPRKLSVVVCDWDMNPQKEFVLDKISARQCVMDIYNEKIYAWDSDLDFENVYIYSYNLD